MKEKIAKLDCQRCFFRSSVKYKPCKLGYPLGKCPGYYGYTDQILSLLKEEIEKVENPYPEDTIWLDFGYGATSMVVNNQHEIFEKCRQAILKALES